MGASTTPSETAKPIDEGPDKHPDVVGVLLGDMILTYIKELSPPLIEKYIPEHIKPASYDLRLGDRYYEDGELKNLTPDDPYIIIKPHRVVVVTTIEILHLPRFLIGRWNLRVGLAYYGLLWAGGPQVDPGYWGLLLCPLYNLSDHDVAIKREDHIFTIDFTKTTPYDKSKVNSIMEEYRSQKVEVELKFKPTKRRLRDYLPPYPLVSSVAKLKEEVKKLEKSVIGRVNDLQTTILVSLSIVFTALTIVATLPFVAGGHLSLSVDPVTALYLVIALGSLIVSVFAINRTKGLGPGSEED